MRRKALIVLLALGTVGGYASGFMSMKHCNSQRRAAFEEHVAKVCVDAARKEDASQAAARPQAAPAANPPVIVQVNAPAAVPAPAAAPAAPAPAAQ